MGRPKSSIFYIKIRTLDGFCVILNRTSLIYLSNNLYYAYAVLKNRKRPKFYKKKGRYKKDFWLWKSQYWLILT